MHPALLMLPLALLLDMACGDPPNKLHPVCLIGWTARKMEAWARCAWGGTFLAGAVAAGIVWAASLLAGELFLLPFIFSSHAFLPWIPTILVIYICMAPRGLAQHAQRVASALAKSDNVEARKAVSMLVGRDTEQLNKHGITRAAIESVAENLTDGVFSTLFWATAGCLIGGIFGAAMAVLTHRVFNILDAMWGKKNDQYRHFGTFAARMDDALNFLPARLILPLIALSAALLPGASASAALRTGWKYRKAHASPNSAWSEAAFAGALDLQIGGPVSYKGMEADYPWIGSGRQDASLRDLTQAIRLMWITTILGTLIFSGLIASILLIQQP